MSLLFPPCHLKHFLFFMQSKAATVGTLPASTAVSSTARGKSGPTSTAGPRLAPAVDMQQLAGQPNTYVVCAPGLHSADEATRRMAQRLAGTLASEYFYG